MEEDEDKKPMSWEEIQDGFKKLAEEMEELALEVRGPQVPKEEP